MNTQSGLLDFDVIIIGGGMVGLATACGLADHHLNVALIEPRLLSDAPLPDSPTLRASAINSASQRYFQQLGIWDALQDTTRVLQFNSIHVWENNGFAKLNAQAADYHYDHLGFIIENQVMQRALLDKARTLANITIFDGVSAADIAQNDTFAKVTLSDDRALSAALIVGADGAHSWVRQHLQLPVIQKKYRHHALITTVETEKPHQACAQQLFYPDGIVAFLPLWRPNLSCLVWSVSPEKAEQLKNCDKSVFDQELSAITQYHLGLCKVINERQVFPLTARYTRHFVQHRLALIGDAAHTIHPLAGQGVNLGFQDSQKLVDTIVRAKQQQRDIGLRPSLKPFERQQQQNALVLLGAMQSIQDIFAGSNVIKKYVRGIGMNLINKTPIVKKMILKRAMGL